MAEKTESETKQETVKLLNKTINNLAELTTEFKKNSSELNHIAQNLNSQAPNNYLQHIEKYMEQINAMTVSLQSAEKRMEVIEDLALFFKQERGNIKAWNGVVSKSIGEVDESLQESVSLLKESIASQIKELTKFTINQREHFEKYIEEQNKLVSKKAEELTTLTDELQHLLGVKQGIQELQRLTQEQSRKFDILAESIYKLMYEESQKKRLHKENSIPIWIKFLIVIITIAILGTFTISVLTYTGANKNRNIDNLELFENTPNSYEN